MGGCLSGKGAFIADGDGDEEAYHNRFLEDKVLGEGQFGVVKLVTDMKANDGAGESMACKVLRKGMVFRDNTIYAPIKPEILKGEIDILRTLAGQFFCLRFIGVYETPKLIYVVTELCSGGEMMQYVSKQSNLRTEDVSRISFQLLSAVDHCAKHRIIHRDIKPENIMFRDPSSSAEIRLIDFGSGVHDSADRSPTERHSTFAGTAFYISPEMFIRTYNSKTDVWSCGATLYVLVAGYPAEELQRAFNILQRGQGRDLRALPGMPDDIPDLYIEMLDQLLHYGFEKRKSAGKMLKHEFVQFHRKHAEVGLSIHDIAAEAATGRPPEEALIGDNSTSRRGRPLQSMQLSDSVRRHSVFLDYQQFERSVTALLATLLVTKDLEFLLQQLTGEVQVEDSQQVTPSKSAVGVNVTKLQVVPVVKLKDTLREMKEDKCLAQIDKMPNAKAYDKFAYHIALLKQFVEDPDKNAGNTLVRRANSMSPGSAKPSSVHGSDIFASFLSKSSKRATGPRGLQRSDSAHSIRSNPV